MRKSGNAQVRTRTGKTASIWLAFLAALCVHVVIILLPVDRTLEAPEFTDAQIEIELTSFREPPLPEDTELEPEPVPEEIAPEPPSEIETEPLEQVVEQPVEPQPVETRPSLLIPAPPVRDPDRKLDMMSEPEINRLTNAILTRQYISEKSVADELFGRPVIQETSETREGFHYPVRPNMITMLDKPLPEIPFAYTPGLVHFAYDPGVKGDLQRFWDVITPEWGFRTKYGTEVRCIWVLVVVGCGWK